MCSFLNAVRYPLAPRAVGLVLALVGLIYCCDGL
jgi:hypothetical protein